MKNVIEILSTFKNKGMSLSLDDSSKNLKLKGNIKHLTDSDKIAIKEHKDEIIFFLKKSKVSKHTAIKAIAGNSSYPLSSAQRSMWVLSQFKSGNIAYNMFDTYRFKGNLNLAFLRKAFDRLIIRHEILRTVFKENEKGEIMQFISSPEAFEFNLNFQDLRSNSDPGNSLEKLIAAEALHSFDLSVGPLLRSGLYQIADAEWVFTCNMHHIISDGWSVNIFVKELLSIYEAFKSGQDSNLAPLRIQYKDYAAWINEQSEKGTGNTNKEYWLNQLNGTLPVLGLEGDNIRPKIKTYNGAIVKQTISDNVNTDFQILCKKQGVTLFVGVLSIIKLLLYKYTHQKDIIIGSPVAGREHVDLENQLGLYINTLALRTQFEETNSFHDLLEKVKETVLGAFEHQTYPFDELVEELKPNRDMSRNALFDIMVILQNNEKQNIEDGFDGLKINKIAQETETSKFDLQFDFTEVGTELEIAITYNTDIYHQHTVEQLLNHLKQLLISVVLTPDEAIKKLDYLNLVEKNHLLIDLNSTSVNYPIDKTIVDLFKEQVAQTPDEIALFFEEQEFTYLELDQRSNQLANFLLSKQELVLEDLIGVKLERNECC